MSGLNQLLQIGQTVFLGDTRSPCHVDGYIGGGGQGEVYKANLDGKDVALKWYFPASATDSQAEALRNLVRHGAPTEKFLWPLNIASSPQTPGFGYVMDLRPANYCNITALMFAQVEPTFRTLMVAGYELAHSFLELHSKGFCYCDISFGNVFFDPTSGSVLICDNDNVRINKSEVSINGTPRFMAPEIVRGEATPSRDTDLFSLAVLLFHMLMVAHPLDGMQEYNIHCFDLTAQKKLYGTSPVFVFDPNNPSNQPHPDIHRNAFTYWPIYPQSLRNLFIKTFTDGLRDAEHGRVQESVWRDELARARDLVFNCVQCGAENFYDPQAVKARAGHPGHCWHCRQELTSPARIRLGNNVVILNPNTQLFPHHIESGRKNDFSQPVAQVVQHPSQAGRWGLRNLTTSKWTCTLKDGAIRDVEPGQSVPISIGVKVALGTCHGEIRA